MNPVMQYKLILQNIEMLANPNDIAFELYELGSLTKQSYQKEIDFIHKNPEMMGHPKTMKKLKHMVSVKFDARPMSMHPKKHHHHHVKTDISAPSNSRKSYSQARKQFKK